MGCFRSGVCHHVGFGMVWTSVCVGGGKLSPGPVVDSLIRRGEGWRNCWLGSLSPCG